MIIWGTRGLTSTQRNGVFHCPRCGPKKPYALRVINRWFTLYFIPIIPLGRAGQYIECNGCAATYGEEVLRYDPETERRAVVESVQRILVVTTLHAGALTENRLVGLQHAIEEITGVVVATEELQREYQLAQAANVQLVPFVQQTAATLTNEGKELVLGGAYLIFTDDGSLSASDEQAITQLGQALGMTFMAVQEFLQRMKKA